VRSLPPCRGRRPRERTAGLRRSRRPLLLRRPRRLLLRTAGPRTPPRSRPTVDVPAAGRPASRPAVSEAGGLALLGSLRSLCGLRLPASHSLPPVARGTGPFRSPTPWCDRPDAVGGPTTAVVVSDPPSPRKSDSGCRRAWSVGPDAPRPADHRRRWGGPTVVAGPVGVRTAVGAAATFDRETACPGGFGTGPRSRQPRRRKHWSEWSERSVQRVAGGGSAGAFQFFAVPTTHRSTETQESAWAFHPAFVPTTHRPTTTRENARRRDSGRQYLPTHRTIREL